MSDGVAGWSHMKPIFILFVSRDTEVDLIRASYPDFDFRAVSFTSLGRPHVRWDRDDPATAVSRLSEEHRKRPFAGVLIRREKHVLASGRLAMDLRLRPLIDDPQLVRDKLAMRRALSGEAFPRSICLESPDQADTVPDSHFPCVVKPRYGFNSRSVVRVHSRSQLRRCLAKQQSCFARLKREDADNCDFVAEEFIPGREHTVDALVVDGNPLVEILSDKAQMPEGFYTEVGDVMPSRLPDDIAQQIKEKARDAVSRLCIRNAWVHVEIKNTPDGPVVVEAAARMGGGYFGEMIQRVYGLDCFRMLMDLHIGKTNFRCPSPRQIVAGRRIIAYGVKWVLGVSGNLRRSLLRDDLGLVWPENLTDVRRLLIGPPFGYKNTILEFLATAGTSERAEALAATVAAGARVYALPLPGILVTALHYAKGSVDS